MTFLISPFMKFSSSMFHEKPADQLTLNCSSLPKLFEPSVRAVSEKTYLFMRM